MITRRKQPSLLKVITDVEVDRIHETSLKILWEVGVKYPNKEMLDRFDGAGAQVDFKNQIVRIPMCLVEKALASLQKNFEETPADGGSSITLGDGSLQLSMDTTPDIVNVMTNTKGNGTVKDTMKGIAVANALDNVRLATAYCLPSEVRQAASDVYCYELLWTYSRKAVAAWIYSSRSADYILEMAKIVAGSEEALQKKKILTYFAEPISPLQYAPQTVEIVLKMAKYGLPIYLGPMVTSGGSGPVTLAGTLAMHNAEILQGLVMTYLCNPTQPVIYSCHCHTLDLRKMVTQYGAPEQALLAVGSTQLAKRYGLAVCGNVMLNDSNQLDYMSGFEDAATATYALAAGWDMLGFMGFGTIGAIGNGVGHSLEKVIVQDEALNYLKRMLASFDVDEETLAFNVIEEVGIGGSFFAEEHTVRHMRDEIWAGRGIFQNQDYVEWSISGAKSTADRAHEKLEAILADSMPISPILTDSKVDSLRYLTREAMEENRGE